MKKKLRFIYTMEYYTALKMNGLLLRTSHKHNIEGEKPDPKEISFI